MLKIQDMGASLYVNTTATLGLYTLPQFFEFLIHIECFFLPRGPSVYISIRKHPASNNKFSN